MNRAGVVDVLVVDDSDFFVEVTADKLATDHDIRTQTASDGREALSVLSDRLVDLVVSDYQMPSMNGLELYREIESEFAIPFILLTGKGNESVASEAIGAGVDDYLQKEAIIEEDQLGLLANRIKNIVAQNRTREKYELLVENTPDEIVEVAADGEILTANPAIATSFSIEQSELLGTQLSNVLPADVAADRLDHGQRAITAGSAVTFQDNVGVRHFHNIAVPISETGERDSIQFISREITQQKRREQQLETKTEELAVINRIVRHDINNDVQLLLGWADGVATHVDEDGMEYVQRIDETCDHIAELTSIARAFVDSLEGNEHVELEPIDVSSVLEKEIEKKRTTFEEATITIEGEVPAVSVRATELLSSVFANLLSNAVRHNDADNPCVAVSTEVEEESLCVSVADNGSGIPDDQKADVFGKGEMGPDSPGTGIGLYLVHTLVDQYGGDVWVDDGPERSDTDLDGAVFTVELPVYAHLE
ncbi:MAG: response regulator [Halorientalis sp.]